MSSDFERELAEDWESASDQLETEGLELSNIEVSVADQMEFEEE